MIESFFDDGLACHAGTTTSQFGGPGGGWQKNCSPFGNSQIFLALADGKVETCPTNRRVMFSGAPTITTFSEPFSPACAGSALYMQCFSASWHIVSFICHKKPSRFLSRVFTHEAVTTVSSAVSFLKSVTSVSASWTSCRAQRATNGCNKSSFSGSSSSCCSSSVGSFGLAWAVGANTNTNQRFKGLWAREQQSDSAVRMCGCVIYLTAINLLLIVSN